MVNVPFDLLIAVYQMKAENILNSNLTSENTMRYETGVTQNCQKFSYTATQIYIMHLF